MPLTPTQQPCIGVPSNAVNLKHECPRLLLTGLHVTHPNHDTWLASFCEEKSGIQSLNTYIKIGLVEYRALCAKGAPRAIPTMCILSIKKDEMLNQLRAKSPINVLSNQEDHIWTKPEKNAPILRPDMMRLLVSLPLNVGAPLNRATARTHFANAFSRTTRSQLLNHPLTTQMPRRTNTSS
jgi:hypothetical protein